MTKPRQRIKKQRHYFVNKGPSSQGYGFSSGKCFFNARPPNRKSISRSQSPYSAQFFF